MFHEIYAWAQANPIGSGAAIVFLHHLFDACVDSLPPPQPMSSPFYTFCFGVANKIAGNYRKKEA